MDFVRWFNDIDMHDTPLVGGKNASLGELYRELSQKGVRVPNGFAVTTDAYRYFLKQNNLAEAIAKLLSRLSGHDIDELQKVGGEIRNLILASSTPADLAEAICQAYDQLEVGIAGGLHVAVRSSATAEDLAQASFAGAQETFLNVCGHHDLLEACKRSFASLYGDRAISYRKEQGYNDEHLALSIGVQRMVRSDLAASGVLFTLDTETGFRNVVLINASYGLGEYVVKGVVVPDEYYVFKPTLKGSNRPIIQKLLGSKEAKLIYENASGTGVKSAIVHDLDRNKFCLSDDDVLVLAKWGCLIEEHYSKKLQRDTPMDIEWGKDGITNELFILQARPETIHAQKKHKVLETYKLKGKGNVLVSGRRVGERIGAGRVRVIDSVDQLKELKEGEVLVTDQTDPDWEPIMKKAAGIVTSRGGRTCHAAIVARELGIPAIVGAVRATTILQDEMPVTVSCAEGELGQVYEGELPYDIEKTDIGTLPKLRTAVMMIVGNPNEAFRWSFFPNQGVGLVRLEFIIDREIQIHPMALVRYPELKDKVAKKRIDELTNGYANKTEYFVDRLARGIALIGAAFYPNDVIVRFSDFKSNEYSNLIGGQEFESPEENPMLGFRGAARYYDPRYKEAFALECQAFQKVRNEMGLKNVKAMIPFCRTPLEATKVLAEMKKAGLERNVDGLEVYVMCEIPSNVVLAREFAELFDGFSIGSNDLTQLVLGVDRDSELVSSLFDERNAAVKEMMRQVITIAKEKGKKIGICGQAPSDYPELCEFLVSLGIDSIALNPDAMMKATLTIKNAEDKLRGAIK